MRNIMRHIFFFLVPALIYQNRAIGAASGSGEPIDMFQLAESGIICMQEGNVFEGEKYFSDVFNARNPEALNEVGAWYAGNDQSVTAINFFNKALAIEGSPFDHAVALNNLGTIRMKSQQFDEAKEALKKAYVFFDDLGKKDARAKEIAFTVLLNLGLVKIKLGKVDKGARCLISSLEACNGAERMYAVACVLLHSGKSDEAKKLFMRIPETAGTPVLISDVLNTLGVIYYKEGAYINARKHFDRSAKLGSPIASDNLRLLQNQLLQQQILPNNT